MERQLLLDISIVEKVRNEFCALGLLLAGEVRCAAGCQPALRYGSSLIFQVPPWIRELLLIQPTHASRGNQIRVGLLCRKTLVYFFRHLRLYVFTGSTLMPARLSGAFLCDASTPLVMTPRRCSLPDVCISNRSDVYSTVCK
jgi:hypothetical protein